jgi:hypothetical protein
MLFTAHSLLLTVHQINSREGWDDMLHFCNVRINPIYFLI